LVQPAPPTLGDHVVELGGLTCIDPRSVRAEVWNLLLWTAWHYDNPWKSSGLFLKQELSVGRTIVCLTMALACICGNLCFAETQIVAAKVKQSPSIDGNCQDDAWSQAPELVTHDTIANLDVRLRAVYTDEKVFFLVQFPDSDESRLHKPWIWNPDKSMYESGPQREDCFVLKWAMQPETTDLSIYSGQEHKADIWFWKANRSDPAGFADDKIDTLTINSSPNAVPIASPDGRTLYLERNGDEGEPAYETVLQLEHREDMINQFSVKIPTSSRADIRAKGTWSNGSWCIELGRDLKTGYPDDVQFETDKHYLLGISRYEIAGRAPDPQQSDPLYGAGDVSEKLFLTFGRSTRN
jgi:hypothetical protein